jgi:hypothetical protein
VKTFDVPKSGKHRNTVFYMRNGRQCQREHVIPADPRTPAQRRARGAVTAAATAGSNLLTDEQRDAWSVAAEKIQSHPRLGQSGPLTWQQHFIGINSVLARVGRGLLVWPPEPVVFGPKPVKGLSISYCNGRVRITLRVSRPVVEDIMVFGQAPCSAGRKKWRHGAYLGMLPAPIGGESDITRIYIAKYGEPEPGKKVFIRTRQQRNGWEDEAKDTSEVVPAKAVVTARPRRAGGVVPGRRAGRMQPRCTRGLRPGLRRGTTRPAPLGQGVFTWPWQGWTGSEGTRSPACTCCCRRKGPERAERRHRARSLSTSAARDECLRRLG